MGKGWFLNMYLCRMNNLLKSLLLSLILLYSSVLVAKDAVEFEFKSGNRIITVEVSAFAGSGKIYHYGARTVCYRPRDVQILSSQEFIVINAPSQLAGCPDNRYVVNKLTGNILSQYRDLNTEWKVDSSDRDFKWTGSRSFENILKIDGRTLSLNEISSISNINGSVHGSNDNSRRSESQLSGGVNMPSEFSKIQADSDEIARLRAENQQLRIQASSAVSVAQQNPRRKALVIGNDRYKNISKLSNAVEDAKAIAANLTKFGYSVSLKLDLTEKDLKAALRAFKNQVDSGDEVAIFYAGHGVQLASTNYLLPVDVGGESEEQIKDEGIPLQRILDDMSEKKAKFVLAMLDACRDNPFKSAGRNISGPRGLAPTSAATGQMVVFSAGAGQQALDKLSPSDTSKNGVFTRVLIKEIVKPGLSIDRVIRNVRNEVVLLAKSVGHEQVPAIYDQVVGEFYFSK